MLKQYFQVDDFIGSALIDLYFNSGYMEDGFMCFRSVPKQDVITWTVMISGCDQNEFFKRALNLVP